MLDIDDKECAPLKTAKTTVVLWNDNLCMRPQPHSYAMPDPIGHPEDLDSIRKLIELDSRLRGNDRFFQ
jgi:hypothetical protein